MKLVSIVVPCYNEEESLPLFYEEIQKIMQQMQNEHSELTFELVFIDDGSRDKTLILLREMALKDMRVRYISFSRNFGKEAGMFAGLENAKGDYVVVMDADLQHPPAFLPKMYNFVKDGEYDCATTRRVSRKGESKIRSAFARLFYKIMNKISQTEIVDGAQDFRFMSRQMVNAILEMHEYNRFSKGIFSWVGFKTRYIEYENVERVAGSTSWSFWGLFRYSLEGIMAFSTAPLMIACILGILACVIGFVLFIVWIVQAVQEDMMRSQTGMMCALFLIGGLQMFCTGISAQYLAKAYMESKHRPIYLMRENEEIYRSRNQDKMQEN
ncbi:MAG: glycosyltransferase family 2 protein [Oscillospiraceae bacterium]|nr:glycosyltransferase family 2 protein [Oscillospiraceae bacterium]